MTVQTSKGTFRRFHLSSDDVAEALADKIAKDMKDHVMTLADNKTWEPSQDGDGIYITLTFEEQTKFGSDESGGAHQ